MYEEKKDSEVSEVSPTVVMIVAREMVEQNQQNRNRAQQIQVS